MFLGSSSEYWPPVLQPLGCGYQSMLTYKTVPQQDQRNQVFITVHSIYSVCTCSMRLQVLYLYLQFTSEYMYLVIIT